MMQAEDILLLFLRMRNWTATVRLSCCQNFSYRQSASKGPNHTSDPRSTAKAPPLSDVARSPPLSPAAPALGLAKQSISCLQTRSLQ